MNYPIFDLGIVLGRINYAESDRIVTYLTKNHGKLKVIAKGVRKERSKLAGGIELFCVSEIGFIDGRSDLATLVSSRLVNNFCSFIDDLERVNFAYESLKTINHITAENADSKYYDLLKHFLIAMNNKKIALATIQVWWLANLAALTGHQINLRRLSNGCDFDEHQKLDFDHTKGCFTVNENGQFNANHIKYLRIATLHAAGSLAQVKGGEQIAEQLSGILSEFVEYHN